jgi:hypothetical protein
MDCTYHRRTPEGDMTSFVDTLHVKKLLETYFATEMVVTALLAYTSFNKNTLYGIMPTSLVLITSEENDKFSWNLA